MKLKVKRDAVTFTGIYTPKKLAQNGKRLGAQFNVLSTDPEGAKVTGFTAQEWAQLKKEYEALKR
jgi:hypothetical protein